MINLFFNWLTFIEKIAHILFLITILSEWNGQIEHTFKSNENMKYVLREQLTYGILKVA